MLDIDGLGAWLDSHHTRDLLRVQTLQYYDVGEDLRRYLAGEDGPEPTAKGRWLQQLRDLTAAGRIWRIVHTIQTPLTDYMRYACEWGYAQNIKAGQDIRLLDVTGTELAGQLDEVGDYYIADGEHVLLMRYDAGRFVGAEPLIHTHTAAALRALGALLWNQAEPFTPWWLSHSEYHRDAHEAA